MQVQTTFFFKKIYIKCSVLPQLPKYGTHPETRGVSVCAARPPSREQRLIQLNHLKVMNRVQRAHLRDISKLQPLIVHAVVLCYE